MKVLFQNRKDVFENWGGDTTQMMETKACLEKYGVEIDINLEINPNLNNYDLVHIFNIQTSDHGVKQVLNAKDSETPIALSPIYWDLSYFLNTKERYIYSPSILISNLARINTNIPHIGTKIFNFYKDKLKRKNIKIMLNDSDIILPNSHSELEMIAILFKMPEVRQKAMIVPNGVSKSQFCNSSNLMSNNLSLPKNYVLEVANFSIIKGQLNLINSLLNHPEIPLVFIGNGLEKSYGKKCMELGKKRTNTYFLGKINHEDIYPYYSNAKVHALPSLRESPGLSTLDAAVSGSNCVVGIHAPIVEYFGFDAFYCDPSNINSIRNAVLKAWNSPKNDKLKNRILNSFTWDEAASRTLEAYHYLTS